MPRHQKIEMLSWRSLDRWIEDNPKPRMTARMKHRAKLWFHNKIANYINVEGMDSVQLQEYVYLLNERDGERMVEYAEEATEE